VNRALPALAAIILAWSALAAATQANVDAAGAGRRLHVNANVAASGDGTSWARAHRYLDEALAAAQHGDEIWVAAGVYSPVQRHITATAFFVPPGVSLYGGFVGGEDSVEQRDPTTAQTVLSAVNPDLPLAANRPRHVIIAAAVTATTRIDGFTIRDGRIDASVCGRWHDSVPHDCDGAGMLVFGSPLLANLRFIENSAGTNGRGGGLAHYSGTLHLQDVLFEMNSAQSGAGFYSNQPDAVYLTRTTAISNTAAAGEGGGWSIVGPSGPVHVRNSRAAGNAAFRGGGMHLANVGTLTQPVNFAGLVVAANYAPTGGGIYVDASSIALTHATIAQNFAQWAVNCSLGSSILLENDSRINFRNTLVMRNFADIIARDASTYTVEASMIDPRSFDANSIDPRFAGLTGDDCLSMRSAWDDLRLRSDSPAVGAGDAALTPADLLVDMAGAPRIFGDAVDAGAYEWNNLPAPTATATRTPRPPTATAAATPAPTRSATPTASATHTVTPSAPRRVRAPLLLRQRFFGAWEVEPNDAWQSANGPLASESTVHGLAANGLPPAQTGGAYKDYYSLDMPMIGAIGVQLMEAGADAQLQLFRDGAIGETLNGNPFVHTFVYSNAAPGRYYVYVNFPRWSSQITYTLRIRME